MKYPPTTIVKTQGYIHFIAKPCNWTARRDSAAAQPHALCIWMDQGLVYQRLALFFQQLDEAGLLLDQGVDAGSFAVDGINNCSCFRWRWHWEDY